MIGAQLLLCFVLRSWAFMRSPQACKVALNGQLGPLHAF